MLEGGSRVWDPTGSATADQIVMNQKSGDFTATATSRRRIAGSEGQFVG